MPHEIHIPFEPEHDETTDDPNQPFGKWAKGQIPFIITQVISILLFAGTFLVYVLDGGEKLTRIITLPQSDFLLSVLNFLFCTFCVYRLSLMFTDNALGEFEYVAVKLSKVLFGNAVLSNNQVEWTKEHKIKLKEIKKLMRLFKNFFLFFWISLSILYACLIIKSFSNSPDRREYKLVSEKIVTIDYLIKDNRPSFDTTLQTSGEERHLDTTYVTIVGSKKDTFPDTIIQKETGSDTVYKKKLQATKDTFSYTIIQKKTGSDTVYKKKLQIKKDTFSAAISPKSINNERYLEIENSVENSDSFKLDSLKSNSELTSEKFFSTLSVLLNTGSAGCLYVLYWILEFASKKNNKENPENKKKLPGIGKILALWLILPCFVLVFIQWKLTGDASFSKEHLSYISIIFLGISGFLNAIFCALLIARLDSKLIGLPRRLIGLLYLYAAVQPLFVVFELPELVNEQIKIAVLVVVFCLKIYFFFIISYALQKGRIFCYLYCHPLFVNKYKNIAKQQTSIDKLSG